MLLEFEVELDGGGVLESRVCGGVGFGGGGLHDRLINYKLYKSSK